MARTTKAAEQQKPNAVIASAVRVPSGVPDPGKVASKDSNEPQERAWQKDLWYAYDTVGEYAFACGWVGNLLSRATLHATKDDGEGPKRVPSGDEADTLMDEFFGSSDGRAQMLRLMGVYYTVPGEAWVVGWEDNVGQHWKIASSTDLKRTGSTWTLVNQPLPDSATVIHFKRPHPRKSSEPTSPGRAALPILSEITRLTQHISAQVDSRLAGAGIMFVPNEIAVAATPGQVMDGEVQTETTAQAFVARLTEVASTAIANREDASALVPIVVTADGEYIDKVKHMKFWSDLDENVGRMRKEAVERLALTLDLPPEVLTGVGEANHWSAWQVDESAVKAHAEPLLALIAADIAEGYLRPALVAGGMDPNEARTYGVGADTSEMRLRPNRSKEALELYDRGELKGEVLLRETGFSKDDRMDEAERKVWLTKKIASGSTTPEQVAAAAADLGVALPAVAEAPSTEARPTPSLLEHPVREIPDEPSAALLAAAEQMVFRALERAGNRLRSATGVRPDGVGAAEMYLFVPCSGPRVDDVLTDAWSHVERFAPALGVDAATLSGTLDSYCRVLITEQKPHDPDLLRRYLSLTRVGG